MWSLRMQSIHYLIFRDKVIFEKKNHTELKNVALKKLLHKFSFAYHTFVESIFCINA